VIPDRKASRQSRRAEHRVLQGQGGFALLVQLVDAVQALTEPPGQDLQQVVILRSERALLRQVDPNDQHSSGMLQRNARRTRLSGDRSEQIGIA
jgi:hypothetical protein